MKLFNVSVKIFNKSVCDLTKHHRRYYCFVVKSTMENNNMSINEKLSERLSPLTQPLKYNVELRPDMNQGVFQGKVQIDIIVKQERDYVNLHTNFLTITDVTVRKDDNELVETHFSEVKPLEQLFIYFKSPIAIGNYKINLEFDGELTRNIVGLYSSRLQDNRFMVASKFQPTYARQAFPCFDEPDFKATYDVKLWAPPTHVALSNMNEISRVHDAESNMDLVTFATSVPMSTYLVCFVICDFKYKEETINTNGIGKNFVLRSYAQKQELHKIDFAQSIGKRATEFYIRYYNVPFPLPKLDMIAIPDYVSGATEHWGLITYRETAFLLDDAKASASNKISVASTITHELAHMWFGNLVTMKWWDEVWLNEGFASYMQVKALDAIEPTWGLMDRFLTYTLHPVLELDAKLSSHPIVQTVATPDQITAIFDSISYNKGASILRMLEGFVGVENFRKGVSDYLKKYAFGNTVTHELLASLDVYFENDHPDLNLSYIMETWTRQSGYPVLSVKPGDEPNSYIISQTRFLLDPDVEYINDSKFKYRWYVPITYKTLNGPSEDIVWLADKDENVKLKLKDGEQLLKLNNNQVGYYRVNYALPMWQTMIEQLKSKSHQFTPADRSNLLDDVFALAEAREVPYHLALDLTSYLLVEDDLTPWEAADFIFSDLRIRLHNSLAYDTLQKYIQHLVRPLYAKQNWDAVDLSVSQSLLRGKILSLAVRCQLPEAEEKTRSVFYTWLNNHGSEGATVQQDLRDFVYYYGMRTASTADWDKLWNVYLNEEDVQEKLKLRKALSAPRDTTILRRYLLLAWDMTKVRSQDYLNVLSAISANPSGTALVWDHVRTHWPELVERFTLNSRYLGGLIPSITNTFDTDLKLKEMEAFFALYPEAGAGEAARHRALETVRNNIKWNAQHLQAVISWLESHK